MDMDIVPFEPPPLPVLSTKPTMHPGSCLALSAPLLAHLDSVLPASPSLTLSIGRGAGLLEALLLARGLRVLGVEVVPSPNVFLPPSHHEIVHVSRVLHSLADEAVAWMFVYPRR